MRSPKGANVRANTALNWDNTERTKGYCELGWGHVLRGELSRVGRGISDGLTLVRNMMME